MTFQRIPPQQSEWLNASSACLLPNGGLKYKTRRGLRRAAYIDTDCNPC